MANVPAPAPHLSLEDGLATGIQPGLGLASVDANERQVTTIGGLTPPGEQLTQPSGMNLAEREPIVRRIAERTPGQHVGVLVVDVNGDPDHGCATAAEQVDDHAAEKR